MVVIPKSVTESRIIENLKSTDIVLSEDDLERLMEIDKNYRLFSMQFFDPENKWDLWDTEQEESYELCVML